MTVDVASGISPEGHVAAKELTSALAPYGVQLREHSLRIKELLRRPERLRPPPDVSEFKRVRRVVVGVKTNDEFSVRVLLKAYDRQTGPIA